MTKTPVRPKGADKREGESGSEDAPALFKFTVQTHRAIINSVEYKVGDTVELSLAEAAQNRRGGVRLTTDPETEQRLVAESES